MGKKLRSYIKPYLQEIYDYTQDKMFDDVLVKSAIIIINKSITNNEMIYYDMANEDKIYINTENLTNKWFLQKIIYLEQGVLEIIFRLLM